MADVISLEFSGLGVVGFRVYEVEDSGRMMTHFIALP